MTFRWLMLAPMCLAGCFLHHGSGDSDSGVDGGTDSSVDPRIDADPATCFELPANFRTLECPASVSIGEPFNVRVTHSAGLCCDSGTPTLSVREARPGVTLISGEWQNLCDCCDGCRCEGPIDASDVGLRLDEEGVHRVQAGDLECEIVVGGSPACVPMTPTEVRAPSVIFEGQQMAFELVQSDPRGCSCQPRLTPIPEDAFSASICDCCDACLCEDPSYAVAYMGPMVGPPAIVDDLEIPTQVRDLDSCTPIPTTGLRIVEPSRSVLRDGPAIHWAVLSGSLNLCCAPPLAGVEELVLAAAGRFLQLRGCVEFDCDCLGRPTPFETWYPLGEYAPGSGDLIRAGEHEVSFRVPE